MPVTGTILTEALQLLQSHDLICNQTQELSNVPFSFNRKTNRGWK